MIGFILAVTAGLPACTPGSASRDEGKAGSPPALDLRVRRGDLRGRFLLTGQLEAIRADDLVVPRTRTWMIAIRWMEADGAVVKAGQKVLEFDNTAFSGDIDEKRLAVFQAESDLAKAEADASAQVAEREFATEQKRVALEKARIEAAVPEEIQDRRKYQERQLALRRAESEFAKAEEDLKAYRESSRADVDTRRIALEKARREVRTAEDAVGSLTLRAPKDGILVVAEHPWEDRKFQVGDNAGAGWTVMRIPDLSAMRVEAQLSDVDDGRIVPGLRATCTLDMYPDDPYPGRVEEVSAVAKEPNYESLRRGFRVVIGLARTDAARMRPGMSVKVEVEAFDRKDVLLAPRAGLDLGADPPRARLAGGSDVEVRIGPCNATHCEVSSGLSDGSLLRSAS